VRGTYSESETYGRHDIVMLNGSSFVALVDNPGTCPGDGWQLWAGRGKTGKPGEPGPQGPAGPAGKDAREVIQFYRDGDEFVILFADGGELRA
jgi:hypothetical protein